MKSFSISGFNVNWIFYIQLRTRLLVTKFHRLQEFWQLLYTFRKHVVTKSMLYNAIVIRVFNYLSRITLSIVRKFSKRVLRYRAANLENSWKLILADESNPSLRRASQPTKIIRANGRKCKYSVSSHSLPISGCVCWIAKAFCTFFSPFCENIGIKFQGRSRRLFSTACAYTVLQRKL